MGKVGLDRKALREHIALVPQDPVIFGTTARENLRYGKLDASDAQIEAAARSAEAHEFLSALALDRLKIILGEGSEQGISSSRR